MKKYKLLKDLPSIEAGRICVTDSNISGYCNCFNESFFKNNPDWFEEVKEKEFTRNDIYNFADFVLTKAEYINSSDGILSKGERLNSLFEQWIRNYNK